jgi:hypothetical protein
MNNPIKRLEDKGHYLRDVVSINPHVLLGLSDKDLKKMPIDKEALKTKMELILRRNNIPVFGGQVNLSLKRFA